MIRLKQAAVALCAFAALNGCGNNGDRADPPTGGLQVTAGDGTFTVAWADDSAVTYWLFISTDPTMTVDNFSTRTDVRIIRGARSPLTLCGYPDGRTLYVAMNGRTGQGPGGPGTPTASVDVRAAGDLWTAGSAPAFDYINVTYAPIASCLATGVPTGIFVAVGSNAAIATSTDGLTFTAQTPPSGFSSDLNAVTSFTANLNNTSSPGLLIVAVGAGGSSVVSTDGIAWTLGAPFNAALPTLRAAAMVAGIFVAAGDTGTVQTSTDGVTWTPRATNTTANLYGAGCFGVTCMVVGENGTILRTIDSGTTWTLQPITGAPTLRRVIFGNFNNNLGSTSPIQINTWLAVGDGGAAYFSIDNGANWTALTVPGAGNIVALSYLTRFVAIDNTGSAFFSQDAQTWTAPVATGLSVPSAVTLNGVGFVGVGAGGQTVSAF
jgi:hypothetical protein